MEISNHTYIHCKTGKLYQLVGIGKHKHRFLALSWWGESIIYTDDKGITLYSRSSKDFFKNFKKLP